MILKKNRMLLPYDGIPRTWWLRNSGTSTVINAPRVLEHFGGLEEGEFMYRILHVYCAWFYFAQRCTRQKVLCLVCIAFYNTCIIECIEHAPNHSLQHSLPNAHCLS